MAISLSDLKKNSKSSLTSIIKATQKLETNKTATDPRYWFPETDKDGNGEFLIRFLPAPKGEDVPFIRYFNYAFKGPGGSWYNNMSLATIGQKDPAAELKSSLYNQGKEEEGKIMSRKETFVSNILVIKDPSNPENNGKVFLYRYGKKIYEKIKSLMEADADLGEDGTNPFDPWNGANFKIKIKQVSGYNNYDDSTFGKPSAISDKDEEIEAVWAKQYSLQELISADKFKSREELVKELNAAMGIGTANTYEKKIERKHEVETDEMLEDIEAATTTPTKSKVTVKADDDEVDLDELLKQMG